MSGAELLLGLGWPCFLPGHQPGAADNGVDVFGLSIILCLGGEGRGEKRHEEYAGSGSVYFMGVFHCEGEGIVD